MKERSRELLDRLTTYLGEPPKKPGTVYHAGLVGACNALEALLREALAYVARREEREPDALVAHESLLPVSVRQASAGLLATSLRLHFTGREERIPDLVRPLVEDVLLPTSAIRTLIDVRNTLGHVGATHDDTATGTSAVSALEPLVRRFRSEAGW